MDKTTARLILASSSPWRRQSLRQLGVTFEATSPDVDETPHEGESPHGLAERLARTKAESIAAGSPDAIVIGADQVADVDGLPVGKPGAIDRARQQLEQQSGRAVAFHSGLCVCAPTLAEPQVAVVTVTTRFRVLNDDEIERYLAAEDVTATAGSMKSEGLGITLAESIESDDPSALIGLPLIMLRRFLAAAGLALP